MDTVGAFHTASEDDSTPASGRKAARNGTARGTGSTAKAAGSTARKTKTTAPATDETRKRKSKDTAAVTSLMPDNIATDPKILDRIRSALARPMTESQRKAQCVSFVYGNMPQSSNLSREEVEALLSRPGRAYP